MASRNDCIVLCLSDCMRWNEFFCLFIVEMICKLEVFLLSFLLLKWSERSRSREKSFKTVFDQESRELCRCLEQWVTRAGSSDEYSDLEIFFHERKIRDCKCHHVPYQIFSFIGHVEGGENEKHASRSLLMQKKDCRLPSMIEVNTSV